MATAADRLAETFRCHEITDDSLFVDTAPAQGPGTARYVDTPKRVASVGLPNPAFQKQGSSSQHSAPA